MYKKILELKIKQIEKEVSELRKNENHPKVKGDLLEGILKDTLLKVLPEYVGVGKGFIIDSKNKSNEIDIVLYNKNCLQPVFISESEKIGYFPIESVVYVIEVKAVYNSQNIQESIDKALKLRSEMNFNGHCCFFAYKSELGKDIWEYLEEKEYLGLINVFCVLDKVYSYYNETFVLCEKCSFSKKIYKHWKGVELKKVEETFLRLVSGIVQTLGGHNLLDKYFFEEEDTKKMLVNSLYSKRVNENWKDDYSEHCFNHCLESYGMIQDRDKKSFKQLVMSDLENHEYGDVSNFKINNKVINECANAFLRKNRHK